MLNVSENPPTRQERLLLWIRRKGRSQSSLAREVGVSSMTFSRWLRAERLSSWRVAQLRRIGIPEELLPPAQDMPPGRRPRVSLEQAASLSA